MAESDALSYWPITIVHESKLLHMATVHYGFIPKFSHHGGKTQKTTITMKDLKKRFLLLLCAVVGCGAAWAQESNVAWVKVTDYTNLSTNDTYVIAGNGISSIGDPTIWCTLKNNQVSSSSNDNGIPIGSTLTLTEDLNQITSSISENETWTLELVSGTNDVYYLKSTKGDWYLRDTEKIGIFIDSKTNANADYCKWKIHVKATSNSNYSVTGLFSTKLERELAVFRTRSTRDWRCYSASGFKNVNGEEVVLYRKMISVSISSAKYASFCSSCPVDFSGTGITVYKAKGTESAVTLTRVEDGIVPANKGVVLYSESAVTNQNVPVAATDGTTDWSDNELIGITERTKISVNGAEGKTNYILSKEGNGVGFYLAASGDGAYLAANRAYLSTSASQQVPQYLGFEEETTGIGSLTPTLSQGEGECYDLSGRRVAQPKNGLYIVNGKKVYVK